ncbi:hypothetical protein J437_LFUL016029 [Ladona fulva]|uniref:PiggyBac transposable element-derived protein domain-containing protein n=1 Tax=Ladona fulva TaxID=123851 RepID=A0A8K0P773_LADFU|nr:hypothetical protein J437_LFUL016029 [Ladona fulva]
MSANRKEFPQTVKSVKLKKGEIKAAFCGKQMVMKWKDKRDVIMVSTFHGTEMCEVEKRGGKIVKPSVVHNYNQNMGGVDKSYGLMNMYKIARNQPKKYYQKIFRHLMDMAMLNAYTIYKKKILGKLSKKEFLITLAEILIENFRKDFQTSQGRLSESPKPSCLTENIFLTLFLQQQKSAQQSDVLCVINKENGRNLNIGVLIVLSVCALLHVLGSTIRNLITDGGNPIPCTFPFPEESSINSENQSYTDMVEYFNFFFNDSMVNMIVEQRNLYAEQCIREQAGSSSGVSNWHPTTSDELRIIFSIVMAQSIVVKPQEVLYSSKNPVIETNFFPKIISHKRYNSVKRYLHFSDNSNYDPNNHPNPKLKKIWPVYKRLNKKFQDAYTPERNVTIDESLMLYKVGWDGSNTFR